jgi:arsenate reductase (thioredoxin)
MATREINVLFLCTGNSARSILAEALLNRFGQGRIQAFSAGSHPKGQVHPTCAAAPAGARHSDGRVAQQGLGRICRSRHSRDDLIVTVCDNAAGEVCPVWPGQPTIAHWGVQDPAAVEGTETERMRAFERAAKALETRIRLLTALHLDQSDRSNLKERLDRIGHSGTEEDQ